MALTFTRPGGPEDLFVKICGVTHAADAELCAQLGVDAIGILLERPGQVRGPDSARLTVAEAAGIAAALPGGLALILLIHDTDVDVILSHCDHIRPHALQLQVNLPAVDLARLRARAPEITLIQRVPIAPRAAAGDVLSSVQRGCNDCAAAALLLDAQRGGSGQVHDWGLSAQIVQRFPEVPIFLAGGLGPDNVRDAIHQVRPWGVDVMTGVTSSATRQRKDPDRLRAFVQAARSQGALHD